MRQFLILVLIVVFFLVAGSAVANGAGPLKVAVIGDTGIGERSYNPGFKKTMEKIRELNPDVLLHAGDFIYRPKGDPKDCSQYREEVKAGLVKGFPHKLFTMGDNDVENSINQRKGYSSVGCWDYLLDLDDPFDPVPDGDPSPGALEGFKKIDNVLFAILDSNHWKDPASWLVPRLLENGRDDWTIFVLHEPILSVAWYNPGFENAENIAAINRLKPDLVFAGHHHGYQRFLPTRLPEEDGGLDYSKRKKGDRANFTRGEGSIHIVTGGGGAFLKPFAEDQEGGRARRHEPPRIFRKAVAKKAVMNHFVFLEITPEKIVGTTYRVCPQNAKGDPRWRPDNSEVWGNTRLACEGVTEEFSVFDEFEIEKTNR